MRSDNIIPIYKIPSSVLNSVQQKWAIGLLRDYCNWTSCALCEYMEKKVGYDRCDCCPLNVGEEKYCRRGWPQFSRLYGGSLYKSNSHTLEWEKNVSDFLYWIEIEKEIAEKMETNKISIIDKIKNIINRIKFF